MSHFYITKKHQNLKRVDGTPQELDRNTKAHGYNKIRGYKSLALTNLTFNFLKLDKLLIFIDLHRDVKNKLVAVWEVTANVLGYYPRGIV
jgi:hypothetical protein